MLYNISELGPICGKSPWEPKTKMLLVYWAKLAKRDCINFLTDNCVIEFAERPTNSLRVLNNTVQEQFDNTEINEHTTNLNEILTKATESYKLKEPNLTNEKLELFQQVFSQKINQKLGSKSEATVVSKQQAKRPKRHVTYELTPEITLKGVCDAILDNGTIIEIKTRTKLENVRKNEYDLYQLFGYMLSYKATKGKIVQRYQDSQWASDEETEDEYGLVDLNEPQWSSKLKCMVKEIKLFNNELFNLVTNKKTQWNLLDFLKSSELPICTINKGRVINRNTKYNKLISYLV